MPLKWRWPAAASRSRDCRRPVWAAGAPVKNRRRGLLRHLRQLAQVHRALDQPARPGTAASGTGERGRSVAAIPPVSRAADEPTRNGRSRLTLSDSRRDGSNHLWAAAPEPFVTNWTQVTLWRHSRYMTRVETVIQPPSICTRRLRPKWRHSPWLLNRSGVELRSDR